MGLGLMAHGLGANGSWTWGCPSAEIRICLSFVL